MIALLDVNVLIALAWPNHVHHEAAHAWYSGYRENGWATCPVTQAGFVRVSSNQRVFPAAKTPAEAFGLLQSITALPDHVFLVDDVDLSRSTDIHGDKILGYRQVTDAHVLAIATSRGAAVATFDRGLKHLVPSDCAAFVIEIPV